MVSTLDTGSSTTPCCIAKLIYRLKGRADTKIGAIECCLCHDVYTLSGHVSIAPDSRGALVGVSRACMHVVVDVASQ